MDFGSIGVAANNTSKITKRPRYDNAGNKNAFFSIDDALDYAGDNSRYQKRVNYIFSFQYAIYSFLLMGFPLLLIKPTFYCKDQDGVGYHQCLEKEACDVGSDNFYVLDSEKTITTAFNLYCGDSYINGILGSVLFLGSFLAFFFFPYFGNWKGRKVGILLANIISAVSALVAAFSPNIFVLTLLLIMGGFAYSGFEILIFVYTAEVSGERFRNYSTVTFGTVWAFAQIIISPLFLLVTDWKQIFIFYMAIPLAISLWPNLLFVYETPRFLNSKKRFAKAREVINNICSINLREPLLARLYGEMEVENSKMATFFPPKQVAARISEQPKAASSSGYLDLFKHKELRRTTLALLYIWFFRNFTYFGLNYSLPVLGTEMYQNFTLTAVAETLANIYAARFKFGVGRIMSLKYSLLVVSLACLFTYFLPVPEECYLGQGCYQKTLSILLAVIAKFGIGLFANILITYTSESYPTEVRALGLGMNLTISRIGTIAMPYIITAMQDSGVSPLVLMGAMGILAFGVTIWCLDETLDREMKDFIVELQNKKDQPLLKNQDAEDSI